MLLFVNLMLIICINALNVVPPSRFDAGIVRTDQTNKAMIFIDGTWLYYSLVQGRDYGCPVRKNFGENWHHDYKVDFRKLPSLIANAIESQLVRDGRHKKFVDIARTHMYTSSKADTRADSLRNKMISDCNNANFQVTHLVTLGQGEKCVDISLAVDMLYLSTVPSAYDIAVIVTGDKDFLPAIEKTRLNAKNVVICSMRNSCNRALAEKIADFDNIWIEDHLNELIVPKFDNNYEKDLTDILVNIISKEPEQSITGRNLGRALQRETVGDQSALNLLKNKYVGVRQFLESRNDEVEVIITDETYPDFIVNLRSDDGNYNNSNDSNTSSSGIDKNALTEVYSAETLTVLKEYCRERDLRVSGTKSELIDRLVESHE